MMKYLENHPGIIKLYLISKLIVPVFGILLFLAIVYFIGFGSAAEFGDTNNALLNIQQGLTEMKEKSDAAQEETKTLMQSMMQQYQDTATRATADIAEVKANITASRARGAAIAAKSAALCKQVENMAEAVTPVTPNFVVPSPAPDTVSPGTEPISTPLDNVAIND